MGEVKGGEVTILKTGLTNLKIKFKLRQEKWIKVLCEQTRELTHDFLDYVKCYLV